MNLCKRIGHYMQQLTQLEGELEDMRQQLQGAEQDRVTELQVTFKEKEGRAQELQETIKGLQWNIPAVWKRVFGIDHTRWGRFTVNDQGYLEKLDLADQGGGALSQDLQERISHSGVFCYLPELKTLNLDRWTIEALPQGIERLTSLENLLLPRNETREIPGSVFTALPNLKVLKLSQSKYLATLPQEIGSLQKLEKIRWSPKVRDDHPGIEVPESLWQLPNLQTVDLFQVRSPLRIEAIKDQSNITSLHLSDITFEGDPSLLWRDKCPKLTELYLGEIRADQADLEALSRGFSDLSALQDFTWEGQDNLTGAMLEPLSRLTSLTKVTLGGKLEGTFPNLQQSKSLKQISLWNLTLSEFPMELLQATSLETLWLSGNGITDIPEGIKALGSLKELHIGNPIATVPESISEIEGLTKLDLDNTQIEEIPEAVALRAQNGLEISMHHTPLAADATRWRAFRERYAINGARIFPNT